MKGRYPDFLCIGAQKAGTTWLSNNLARHPDIWVPPKKELHYFDHLNDPPMHPLRHFMDERWRVQFKWRMKAVVKHLSVAELMWNMNYFFGERSEEWYQSLFEQGKDQVVGELTPAYSTLDEATVRYVNHVMPAARILFFLRNPIERAWSHAVMDLSILSGRDIREVSEAEFIQHFDGSESRLRGDYMRVMDIWQSVYSEEQFFIGFIEDVANQPEKLLHRVFHFLGVGEAGDSVGGQSRRKVHEGGHSRIPASYMQYLEDLYRDPIIQLSRYFEGQEAEYVKSWLCHE